MNNSIRLQYFLGLTLILLSITGCKDGGDCNKGSEANTSISQSKNDNLPISAVPELPTFSIFGMGLVGILLIENLRKKSI